MLYTSLELIRVHICKKLSYRKNKECQLLGWTSQQGSCKEYITMLLKMCQNKQVGPTLWVHRNSEGLLLFYKRTASTPLRFVRMNQDTDDPANQNQQSTEPRVQEWRCSAWGGRWPQSGHRPSQSGDSHPTCKLCERIHLSDAAVTGYNCSESGCSAAPLGWWRKWN